MSIILDIFLGILWLALILGTIVGAVAACMRWGKTLPKVVGLALAGAALVSVVIGLPFATGMITFEDNSEHCGPGTAYHSNTRIIGKTPVTEWQCDRA